MLRYVECPANPDLRARLECVWEVRDPRPRRGPERVVPDGCPELILHLGNPFARRVGQRWVNQPRAFLAGVLTRPWMLRAGRRIHTLGIRFKPGALGAFFRLSLASCADRELPLQRLHGARESAALLRRLRGARSQTARLAHAQAWLRPRLETRDPRSDARQAVRLMLAARGQRRVEEVAKALGWTRRRLERTFAREVGMRPKLFARIVRLNAVLAGLDEDERASAVDVALDAGYFDQAHLLRDFRALAGRRPRAAREQDGELARNFTRPQRLRTLLAGE